MRYLPLLLKTIKWIGWFAFSLFILSRIFLWSTMSFFTVVIAFNSLLIFITIATVKFFLDNLKVIFYKFPKGLESNESYIQLVPYYGHGICRVIAIALFILFIHTLSTVPEWFIEDMKDSFFLESSRRYHIEWFEKSIFPIMLKFWFSFAYTAIVYWSVFCLGWAFKWVKEGFQKKKK